MKKTVISLVVILAVLTNVLFINAYTVFDEGAALRYEFEDYVEGFTATSDKASDGEYVACYSASKATEKPEISVPINVTSAGWYDITYVVAKKYGGGLVTLTLSDGTNTKTIGTNEGDGIAKLDPYTSHVNDKTYFPARMYKKEKVWLGSGDYTLSISVGQVTSNSIKCYLYMLDYIEFAICPPASILGDETTAIEFEDYIQTGKTASDKASDGEYVNITNTAENPSVLINLDVKKEGYYNISFVAGKKTDDQSVVTFKLGNATIGTNEDDESGEAELYGDIPMSKFVKEAVWVDSGENVLNVEIGARSNGKYLFQLDYIEFEPVTGADITVQNSDEIPGIDTDIYLKLENGKNVYTIKFLLTFDKAVITAKENVAVSDEFELVSVNCQEGKISAELKRKTALSSEPIEFCAIPVSISENAEFKEYQVEIEAELKGKNEINLEANVSGGVINVLENTPKYDVLNDAIEALSALKRAEDIGIDDYDAERIKAENARQNVDIAYGLSLRDSQIGVSLIENLMAVEERLEYLKSCFDALEAVENASSEDVVSVIKTNKEKLEITDKALEIYDGLEDKLQIDKIIAETEFDKPSDLYKVFHEILVLEGVKQTRWQNTKALLELADETTEIDLTEYNDLSDEQKNEVNKEIAKNEYSSIASLQLAIDEETEKAKEIKTSRPTGSGSGGSSGGSRGDSGKTIYVQPPTVTQTPSEKNEVFNDIKEFDWAKEAIEYLYKNGVINGKGNGEFAPSLNVTREEFAKMTALAFDISLMDSAKEFKDVAKDSWHAKFVYSLAEAGVINGRDDGSFGVGDYITREEIAVILNRIISLKKITITSKETPDIKDESEISIYAKESIEKMYGAGIISGFDDGTLKPKESASRAQTAQLIYKVLMFGK